MAQRENTKAVITKRAASRQRSGWRGTGLAIALAGFVFLLIIAITSTSSGIAFAGNEVGGYGVVQTPENGETPVATYSPTVAAVEATAVFSPTVTARWEEQALLELADQLGWPATVIVDGTGMYLVQLNLSERDWAQAAIRPFSYGPSAEAAFSAEQEDARLSGFAVQPTTFYTYPAYSATITAPDGSIIERRLRWLADNWIFGVSLHGTSDPISSLDSNTVGRDLLLIAIDQGLTPPPGGVIPTPLPPTQGVTPSPTATLVTCDLSFPDVTPNYWAYRYIMELACEGIVSGHSNGKFRPDDPTTRAQLAKMIVLSEDWPLVNPSEPSFTDVERSNIFYSYVETAYAHNILSGYPNKTFKPDSYVTRAQVAKMLVRSRGWPISLQGQPSIALCDVPANHWAWIYVQVAIQHGTFNGYANGCFLPDASATRAQIAKVLVEAHH